MPIELSKRQVKDADRFSGACLMLPWPASLPEPRPPFPKFRGATPAERTIARAEIAATCEAHGFVIQDIMVGWPTKPAAKGRPYFQVYIVHRRWPQSLDHSDAAESARWLWLQ